MTNLRKRLHEITIAIESMGEGKSKEAKNIMEQNQL